MLGWKGKVPDDGVMGNGIEALDEPDVFRDGFRRFLFRKDEKDDADDREGTEGLPLKP